MPPLSVEALVSLLISLRQSPTSKTTPSHKVLIFLIMGYIKESVTDNRSEKHYYRITRRWYKINSERKGIIVIQTKSDSNVIIFFFYTKIEHFTNYQFTL